MYFAVNRHKHKGIQTWQEAVLLSSLVLIRGICPSGPPMVSRATITVPYTYDRQDRLLKINSFLFIKKAPYTNLATFEVNN